MAGQVYESGSFKNVTDSAAISASPGVMVGFYVNSTSSGIINFKDGGASGTAMCGNITPAIGFHRFPAVCASGLYITKVSGTIDVTVFYQPNPTPTSNNT